MVSERKRGTGKEITIILTGRNVLQVGEDPGYQRAEWRRFLVNAQESWQVVTGNGSCRKLHIMN